MKRLPIAIALSAIALTALAGCETTDGAGQTAQSSETIKWDTPRPAEPPAAREHKPAHQPPEPQCREYQTTVIIGGKPEKAYGRACRQPDGTWKQVGVHKPTAPAAPTSDVEQTYPYGWHGYEYPHGPRYGPGGLSVGVGAGSGSGGGFIGTGVGVGF